MLRQSENQTRQFPMAVFLVLALGLVRLQMPKPAGLPQHEGNSLADPELHVGMAASCALELVQFFRVVS